jgi:Cu(I)/Ag(I) efflux system membrane protein CusA/SilA
VKDVFTYVEAGLGGMTVGTTVRGRERWPLQVRLADADRSDIDRLTELVLPTPSGASIRLGQVADIRRVVGPNEIASENGRLRVFVQANVQDRDLGGFVAEIKERVSREIRLDPGMTVVVLAASTEHQLRARRTLAYVFPAVILIIFVLLVVTFGSMAEAAHVLLAVPFALTGGVLLQAWLDFNFSVAVWVGYIALFGTAIQTGVIMVVYLREAVEHARAENSNLSRDELLHGHQGGGSPPTAPEGDDRRHARSPPCSRSSGASAPAWRSCSPSPPRVVGGMLLKPRAHPRS